MLLRKSENKGYAARIYYARYDSKFLAWIISFIILLIQSCDQKNQSYQIGPIVSPLWFYRWKNRDTES